MRAALIFVCIAFVSACGSQENATLVQANDSQLLLEGRTLKTERGTLLSYPGSRIRFATQGDEVQFKIEPEGNIETLALDVRVNDDDWGTVELNRYEPVTILVGGEENGMSVDIIRRNEAWQGNITLLDVSSFHGFVEPKPFPKTKLLFIGDSITAGAGTTSRLYDEGEREAVSNARLAYPRVLGDRLNAQVHHVAYGGRGLTRDWQGITETNNAPQFYDRVLPDNPDHLWDPKSYKADIVSVMLGTNDFNPGIPDRENWTQVYKNFVTRIRTDYPKAQIFLISSPMTGGEKGEALKGYVKEVADGFGTPSVQYLEVGQYYGEAWDSHPTAAEHQKIADELETAFREALGE